MKLNISTVLDKIIPRTSEDRLKLKQVTGNFSWLMGDRILRMGMGMLITIWIARYLGPDDFGLLNYSIAFVAILSIISNLGLDQIVIRNLLQKPEDKYNLLGSAVVLRICGSFLLIFIAWLFLFVIKPPDDLSNYLVLLIAVGTLFQSFDIIDFWFQSRIESKFTVIAKNAAFILASAFRVVLILSNAGLIFFAWAILIEYFLGASGLVIIYFTNKNNLLHWKFRYDIAKNLLKDSWPLILTGVAIMIYMRIDQIMLKEMIGDAAVGVYSAAVRLVEVWYFIPMAIVNSVFPVIVETKKIDENLYLRRLSRLYRIITWTSIIIAVITTIFADFIIGLLYGNEYNGAGAILSLSIWGGIFAFQGVARGAWLINENLQKYSYYYTIGASIVNIAMNFVLIPLYGGIGAAVATVVSYFCSVILIPLFFAQTRSSSIQLLKSFIWR